jgi:hypothetical protein
MYSSKTATYFHKWVFLATYGNKSVSLAMNTHLSERPLPLVLNLSAPIDADAMVVD